MQSQFDPRNQPLSGGYNLFTDEMVSREAEEMGDAIAQRSFRKRKYVTSERVLLLEQALDLTMFIKQLESLIAQPIKIPSNHQLFATNGKHNAHNFFSVDGIWPDEVTHRGEVGKLFNTLEVEGDRNQLLSLMIDDSDTDSGGEQPMTVKNLHDMLKVHRKRRRYQTKCHDDPLNMQYKYYGAGLFSGHDKFSSHQQEVKTAFSYDFIEKNDDSPVIHDAYGEFDQLAESENGDFNSAEADYEPGSWVSEDIDAANLVEMQEWHSDGMEVPNYVEGDVWPPAEVEAGNFVEGEGWIDAEHDAQHFEDDQPQHLVETDNVPFGDVVDESFMEIEAGNVTGLEDASLTDPSARSSAESDVKPCLSGGTELSLDRECEPCADQVVEASVQFDFEPPLNREVESVAQLDEVSFVDPESVTGFGVHEYIFERHIPVDGEIVKKEFVEDPTE